MTTTNLTVGTIGVPYTSTLSASGGLAPYSWALVGGSLPPGLSLSSDGTISGTPTISGRYPVTFAVTDSNLLSGTADLVVVGQAARRSGLLGGRQRRRHLQLRRARSSTGPRGACT